MILIADSGSTKTDWCVVLNGTLIKRIGTKGINPFFQSEEDIQREPVSYTHLRAHETLRQSRMPSSA